MEHLLAPLLLGVLVIVGILLSWILRRKPLWAFICTVMTLLLAGLMFLSSRVPYLSTSLSESLGASFVIAAVLSLTVDVYLKGRVLREVSSDVSKYLIGYRLPEAIQDRIRELLQTQWIRRNCQIRCRLSVLADRPGYVRLEVTIADEMENITGETRIYQETIEFEKHDFEKVIELRCDCDDPKSSYSLRGENLANEKKEEPGVIVARGKKVKIPPVKNNQGHPYRFTARYEIVHPEKYSDVVSFSKPTMGVVLEIECPENFRVSASPADVETRNRWEYKRLFLPGDHIRFRWETR